MVFEVASKNPWYCAKPRSTTGASGVPEIRGSAVALIILEKQRRRNEYNFARVIMGFVWVRNTGVRNGHFIYV